MNLLPGSAGVPCPAPNAAAREASWHWPCHLVGIPYLPNTLGMVATLTPRDISVILQYCGVCLNRTGGGGRSDFYRVSPQLLRWSQALNSPLCMLLPLSGSLSLPLHHLANSYSFYHLISPQCELLCGAPVAKSWTPLWTTTYSCPGRSLHNSRGCHFHLLHWNTYEQCPRGNARSLSPEQRQTQFQSQVAVSKCINRRAN